MCVVLASWRAARDSGVMVNFRAVERDQLLLMPPSLSDWLPSDHLAWFIVDVVAELNMSGFYRSLRSDVPPLRINLAPSRSPSSTSNQSR